MLRAALVASVLVLFAAPQLHAQAHPCDGQLPTSIKQVRVGQEFEFGVCHDLKDSADNVNAVTGFRIYRNDVLLTPVTSRSATANAEGLWYVFIRRTEPAIGTVSYTASAMTSAGEGPRGVPLSLSVVPSITTAPAPTRPRIVVVGP
jgi:hypothetical protein